MRIEKSNTLAILFWANFLAFGAHVLDETFMAGGFVAFIQRHFWSGFQLNDFFTANAIWLVLIAISNLLYNLLGNRVAAVPMAFVWERLFNGLFHFGSAAYFKEYSPGLLTSAFFFAIIYLMIRYSVQKGQMRMSAFFGSAVPALVFETVFVSSMWWAH